MTPRRKVSRPRPLILISPDFEKQGVEFNDSSLSLSKRYPEAIELCGGVPLVMPHTTERGTIAEYVRHADGVLLTGGDDINPALSAPRAGAALKARSIITEDGGTRDLFELLLVDEIFRQQKPLLAICRGHQLLNVALGGTLLVDIPTQRPSRINHRQMDRKMEVVHSVRLTAGSLLAKMTNTRWLGVNSTHHQAVDRVAAALKPVAISADGIVEATELRKEDPLPFLLSVQFHPERLLDEHPGHRAIFEAFVCASQTVKTQRL
jgi:putative glutamine amidotransferase